MISWSRAALYVLFWSAWFCLVFFCCLVLFFFYPSDETVWLVKLIKWKKKNLPLQNQQKDPRILWVTRLVSGHCDPRLTSYILWSCPTSGLHTCLLVLKKWDSRARTLLPAATKEPAFLRLFGEELGNHFHVVLCRTHYIMSASFGQHHGWVYPTTLTLANPSK